MTDASRIKEKAARTRFSRAFLCRYCSPTGPENDPLVPLARTSLFANVNIAPPLKLKPCAITDNR
jgi:hypothetical protein